MRPVATFEFPVFSSTNCKILIDQHMIMLEMFQPHWQDCYQHAPGPCFQQLVRLYWQAVAYTRRGKSCTPSCKLEKCSAEPVATQIGHQAFTPFQNTGSWHPALRRVAVW